MNDLELRILSQNELKAVMTEAEMLRSEAVRGAFAKMATWLSLGFKRLGGLGLKQA